MAENERIAAEQVLASQPVSMDDVLAHQLKVGRYRTIGTLRAWFENTIAELDRQTKLDKH